MVMFGYVRKKDAVLATRGGARAAAAKVKARNDQVYCCCKYLILVDMIESDGHNGERADCSGRGGRPFLPRKGCSIQAGVP